MKRQVKFRDHNIVWDGGYAVSSALRCKSDVRPRRMMRIAPSRKDGLLHNMLRECFFSKTSDSRLPSQHV